MPASQASLCISHLLASPSRAPAPVTHDEGVWCLHGVSPVLPPSTGLASRRRASCVAEVAPLETGATADMTGRVTFTSAADLEGVRGSSRRLLFHMSQTSVSFMERAAV